MLLIEDKTSKLLNLISRNITTETYIDNEADYCELDNILWDIDNTLEIARGASKFVINDGISPFVIKIPFVGSCMEIYDDELEDYTDEYDYINFERANKDCGWDYCYDEVEKYETAVAAGFGEFFPFTTFSHENKYGVRFYLSERVDPDFIFSGASENSKTKAKKLSHYKRNGYDCTFINEDFVAKCIDYYGYEKTSAFIDWLHTQPEITEDLHSGNFGMRFNGAPVILDFSGFRD